MFITVVFSRSRFVGFTVANQVRCNHAHSGLVQMRNHFPIQITPYGLAMHAEDNRAISGALVDVMDAQFIAVFSCDVGVVGRKRIILQAFKADIRGSQNSHRSSSSQPVSDKM